MILSVNAYAINLAVLVCLLGGTYYSRYKRSGQGKYAPVSSEGSSSETAGEEEHKGGENDAVEARWGAFRNRFLRVYVLAVGADWLQVCRNTPSPELRPGRARNKKRKANMTLPRAPSSTASTKTPTTSPSRR